MKKLHFLILGNESRQLFLKELLTNRGHDVTMSEEYVEGDYDAFLLPVPTSAVYYEKIKDKIHSGQYIFGCNIPVDESEQLEPQKQLKAMSALRTANDKKLNEVHVVEYMKSNSVAYKNAIATAEGAISEAIRISDINLHGSRVLVTGYGRCGEILANKLRGLNCQVTVMDRKQEKRAKAQAYGFDTLDFDIKQLTKKDSKTFGFVFNTVPKLVLDQSMLSCFSNDVCMIDIASKPGGIDYNYCKKNGINAVLLPGLPGKYAPKTSAEILLEVIQDSMCDWEV